jgi:hypothetical protein
LFAEFVVELKRKIFNYFKDNLPSSRIRPEKRVSRFTAQVML